MAVGAGVKAAGRCRQFRRKRERCRQRPPDACRRMVEKQAASDEGVDGDENKADAIDAGEGSELVDKGVVDLGVAELIPGDGGDAGGGEFEAGPEDGGSGEGETGATGGLAYQGDGECRRRRSRVRGRGCIR